METPPVQHTMRKEVLRSKQKSIFTTRTIGLIALALLILVGAVFALEYAKGAGSSRTQGAGAASAYDAFVDISLRAQAAIVIDVKSGTTLFALNPDAQLPLASLTKVPLALTVSEVLGSDEVLTIPRDTAPAGSAERLAAGEKWRVQDIIDFTLVASSNGGAEILAEAANYALHERYPLSPEDSATLWRMNDLARSLHLSRTYFLNVHGLDLSTSLAGAYGSAHDMAALFAYAASANPSLFADTARDGILLTSPNGVSKTSALNTNEAQGAIPGLIMGKTGFTDLAGGNLVVVFDVGLAHPVVAVVLGSTRDERFEDMQKLVAAARNSVVGKQ